jgi:hypothetical protein
MLNGVLSDRRLSGDSATGVVYGIAARQAIAVGVGLSWAARGYDLDANSWFLIYLNGRFTSRVPGSVFNASLLTPSYDIQDVQVIPWRRDMATPEEWYGSAIGTRAHIEWTRDTDTSISYYNIYRSTTLGGTYELIDSRTALAVESGIFEMASGAECRVEGNYAGEDHHTNSLFTLTITNAAARLLTITNDKNANTVSINYVIGQSFALLDGIQIAITGTPVDADTASFVVGVLPFYDTTPLANGNWFFKIAQVDTVGNEATLSEALEIVIAGPPSPVQDFAVHYDEDTDDLIALVTQSTDAAAVGVNIYSNFCTDTGALLDKVFYDWPILQLTLATGIASGPETILNAAGKPAGTYRFIARAVTADGVEDGAAVEVTFELPYHPSDLPTPYGLTATPLVAGAVKLSWYSGPVPADWEITGLATDPIHIEIAPQAVNATFFYEHEVAVADVGPEGTYTASVAARSVNGSRTGTAAAIEFTSDATPPAPAAGLMGVAF